MDRVKIYFSAVLFLIPIVVWSKVEEIKNKVLEPELRINDLISKSEEALKERDYNATFEFLFAAKDAAQKANNTEQLSLVHYKLGYSYYRFDNSTSSIKHMNKALIIPKGLDKEHRLKAYGTLGNNHSIHGDYTAAIKHYKNAIALMNEVSQITGNHYEFLYNNIALSFMGLAQYDSAKFYHHLCLQERLAMKDTFSLGQTYNNLGTLFYELAQYDSALFYFDLGLEHRQKASKQVASSLLESQINMGKALIALKKYALAKSILVSSLNTAVESHNAILEMRTVEQLEKLYTASGNYEQALLNANRFHTLKDSLFSIGQKEEIIKLTTATQFEEKILADSLIRYEQKVQQDIIAAQEKKTSNFIKYGLMGALVLVIGIMLLIYRNYINGKKSSTIILQQKELAEKQKIEIDHQHKELQQTHKEITDSIAYAKRIQSAILPPKKLVKEYLKDSFVLYKPKDVVAGDFYWMEPLTSGVLFAAADCTGHGVPGAMVSVVCNNALNRCVKELKLTDPGEILNHTRDMVVAEFGKSDEVVSDGMDIALCLLEKSTLKYAGAHNPLWIIRNEELIETTANKQPIGKFYHPESFKTHTIDLQKGDTIYIFSDGYADQFGGEKGKKLKASSFKKLLLSLNQESMENQHQLIDKAFEDWKGDLEQLDDVCVIGIRV